MAAQINAIENLATPALEHAEPKFLLPTANDDHNDHRAMKPDTRHGLRVSLSPRTQDKMTVSRDFEHAIIDDDEETKDILSPNVLRRGRHSRLAQNHSRESSASDRSSSPANSVDAFANPRRRERAGTIGSRAESDFEAALNRTVSGGTNRRRPTFNDGSVRNPTLATDRTSLRDALEADISFPAEEESHKTFKIDFEELDEFVAENRRLRHQTRGWQKLSFSSHGEKPKLSSLLTVDQSPIAQSSDAAHDSDATLDEKLGVHAGAVEKPVRYSFFSSELEKTIHASEFGDLLAPNETFRDLFDIPPGSGVWWLDIVDPTEDELQVFQRAFGVHRLTTEDISTQEAREKVELFKAYYFVCFRSFFQVNDQHEESMEPLNVYMVVFREGIISIAYTKSPHAGNVRKRIGKLRDYMALTADWICYAMIDNIVDTFGPPIHTIELEADTIEDQVFVARTDDFGPLLRQIGNSRRKVMSLMRLLGGKADVIKGFAKRCNEQYSVTPRGEIGLYLGDIQDHVVTMMSNLGHFEKMLSRSHSNYLAQLSVDQIAQGNRANKVLSKITLLASILVPLNLICGLFGMNVPVPGRSSDGLGWFFGIIGGIATFTIICLALARAYRFI